ncbi:type II DNA modification enzyme (methyltransferase) [Moraxella macacae 0408225]|uniref:site-specific DNA-methyltransferase (adenine-specific) n=1 Tax=Moraxella macacae 0408225 TaxID=1230338 RepID=L2F6Z0_9GAMM|nr:site-specific DNA-methyltransferase [Moraxella macacae]ELA08213.1 type II DNA modification enzyme (methyltransferase) [Moraxella macacae 0408225]
MDADNCLKHLANNSVQMVYIDPPYNTQSTSFEYHDNLADWDDFMGQKLTKTRDLLKDTGFVFISIDDNKLAELLALCYQIFAKKNFLGVFITRQATRSNAKHINTTHEYIVAFAKNKQLAPKFAIKRLALPFYQKKLNPLINKIKKIYQHEGIDKANIALKQALKEFEPLDEFSWLKNYNIVDEQGEICFATDLSTPGEPNCLHIPEINLTLQPLKTRAWSSKEKIIKLFYANKLIFKNGRPYEKHLLKNATDSAMSLLNFYSRQGKHDLAKLNMEALFSTAKPVEMIKYLLRIATPNPDDIVLDYFAGSGTTAQAVLECNHEDNTHKQFILCQIDEPIKQNAFAINYLIKHHYPPSIASITQLRLERLKQHFNFSYETVTMNTVTMNTVTTTLITTTNLQKEQLWQNTSPF